MCPIYEDDEQQIAKNECVSGSSPSPQTDSKFSKKAVDPFTTLFWATGANKSEDLMSQDIDCQIGDIYLPDESMRSQSDNWSMKSYPVNSPVPDELQFANWANCGLSEVGENSSKRGDSNTEKSSGKDNEDQPKDGDGEGSVNEDAAMPAPPKRKRKKYVMLKNTSRKRKRK